MSDVIPAEAVIPTAADPLLTVDEVATRFAVSPYTVREWCKDGKIRGVKLNRQWRIQQSEMIRYANEKYGSN